jgi:hypothetical protein
MLAVERFAVEETIILPMVIMAINSPNVNCSFSTANVPKIIRETEDQNGLFFFLEKINTQKRQNNN